MTKDFFYTSIECESNQNLSILHSSQDIKLKIQLVN